MKGGFTGTCIHFESKLPVSLERFTVDLSEGVWHNEPPDIIAAFSQTSWSAEATVKTLWHSRTHDLMLLFRGFVASSLSLSLSLSDSGVWVDGALIVPVCGCTPCWGGISSVTSHWSGSDPLRRGCEGCHGGRRRVTEEISPKAVGLMGRRGVVGSIKYRCEWRGVRSVLCVNFSTGLFGVRRLNCFEECVSALVGDTCVSLHRESTRSDATDERSRLAWFWCLFSCLMTRLTFPW